MFEYIYSIFLCLINISEHKFNKISLLLTIFVYTRINTYNKMISFKCMIYNITNLYIIHNSALFKEWIIIKSKKGRELCFD